MNTLTLNTLTDSINILLTEAYAGPPDPSATWFIDNEPNSGILGILAGVTAKEASTSVHASGDPGSTIAANAEHLRWSLAQANADIRGEPYQSNWSESWRLLSTDQAGWDRLRADLRMEFESLQEGIKTLTDVQGETLIGLIALLPHAAYHLGSIRQMVERVREPGK